MKRSLLLVTLCCLAVFWGYASDAKTDELLFPNSDFEQGDLTNWNTEGTAFGNQPTRGDNVRLRRSNRTAMPQGNFWISSYEDYQGKPGQKPGGKRTDKIRGGLYSTTFLVAQPYIAFLVGGGCFPEVKVQLVVGGRVVRAATGAFSEAMRRVIWDVSEYQDQKAMLYILDHSEQGWGHISADDFRFRTENPDRLLFPNSDFEVGNLSNWTADGEAFGQQPEKVDYAALGIDPLTSPAPTGQYWMRSGGPDEAKPPGKTGALKSIPFTVKGKLIAFQVRGGSDAGLKVELQVEGQRIHWLYGIRSPSMRNIAWEVEKHFGKTAELVITDESGKPGEDICADNFHYGRLD